jgi:hypothetical protein
VSDVLLNGRVPRDWELDIIRRGREHQREKDTEQLRGVLAGGDTAHAPRPSSASALLADIDIIGGLL